MIRRSFFIFFKLAVILSTVVFFSVESANACSCLESGAPCHAYWNTDVVFSGTAKSWSKAKPDTENRFADNSVRFALDSVYKGLLPGPEVSVRTGSGGGDCGYHFEPGKRYLVYAWTMKDGSLVTSICSRTRLLSEAEEDLEYFRNIPVANSGAKITVNISRYVVPLKTPEKFETTPMQGITVTAVQGDLNFKGSTNEKGFVELLGLPPGKYKVKSSLAPNDRSYVETEVTVVDRGCASVEFYSRVDGGITGKVVDGNGNIINGVRVDLLASSDAMLESPTGRWAFTNSSGEYRLNDVPPGTYILGVNLTVKSSAECPVARSFYINPSSSQAGFVEVKDSEQLQNHDMQLQVAGPEREIHGIVTWPNGRPAPRTVVKQISSSTSHYLINGQTVTDDNGRFSLRGVEGCAYQIYAFKYGGRISAQSEEIEEQAHAEPVTVKFVSSQPVVRFVLTTPGFIHSDNEKRFSPKP